MTDLIVDSNRFEGILPANLGYIFSSRLRQFQIRGNLFNGTLPNSFSIFKPSILLVLDANNFTGCIPPFNYTYYKQSSRSCTLRQTPPSLFLCCHPPALTPNGIDICGVTTCSGTGQLAGEIPCPPPAPSSDYTCVNGTWSIVSDVVVPANTTVSFPPQVVTIIVGSLTLTNTSTLQITPSTTVVVTECVTLSGSLNVVFNASEAAVTGTNKSQEIIKSDPSCSSGTFTSVTATVAGCSDYKVDTSVSYRSGSVIFSYNFQESNCEGASPSLQIQGDSNWRVITGAVVGSVLGLVVITAVIILAVPALRYNVFPFLKLRVNSIRQSTLDD
eukprot:TRINITY_DN1895_c0_g1_i2.p1 TRINITY_DN1895_c0_g1~~TRINITY_DN1895_c0_g1_i2.p1  ORF type:complete len:330 (+),score=35.56 TRINITY_DN1895_c0_g1_i2:1179-2168(+)